MKDSSKSLKSKLFLWLFFGEHFWDDKIFIAVIWEIRLFLEFCFILCVSIQSPPQYPAIGTQQTTQQVFGHKRGSC